MTINAPKYQSCPECGARCKRTSKSNLRLAYYEHKGCKKHSREGEVVRWNVKLR